MEEQRPGRLRDRGLRPALPRQAEVAEVTATGQHGAGDREDLRRAAAGKGPKDLLFTGVRGGPIEEHFTDRRWAAGIEKAKAKGLYKTPRFHDLRHTHASWLISAGVPLPVIQRRLGHDSIKTTVDIYGGLLDQAQEAADDAIEAALVHGRVPSPTRSRLVVVPEDEDYEADPGVDDAVVYDPDDEALPEIDSDVA